MRHIPRARPSLGRSRELFYVCFWQLETFATCRRLAGPASIGAGYFSLNIAIVVELMPDASQSSFGARRRGLDRDLKRRRGLLDDRGGEA